MALFRRPVRTAANNVSNTSAWITHVTRQIDSLLDRYEKQGFIELEVIIGRILSQEQQEHLNKFLGPRLSHISSLFNIPLNIKVKLPPK